MENKEYLNSNDIVFIEERARNSQVLRQPLIVGNLHAKNILAIAKISEHHLLILIHGNRYFGLEHIKSRHDYSLSQTNWKNGKLSDPPGSFPEYILPLFDYVKYADDLYQEKYKKQSSEHALLDVYEGVPKFGNPEKFIFRLLLYRNTKIIHTLYPIKKYNKKKTSKQFVFLRGGVTVKDEHPAGKRTIDIRYVGEDKQLKYLVTLIQDLNKSEEEWFFTEAAEDGSIGSEPNFIKKHIMPKDTTELGLGFMANLYRHAEYPELEEELLKFHKKSVS